MKCYELTQYWGLSEGFPLRVHCARPYVPVQVPGIPSSGPEYEAPLCDEYVELLRRSYFGGIFAHESRLLRCDIEVRSQIYLVPERDQDSRGVLILFHARESMRYTTSWADFKVSGTSGSCDLLVEHQVETRNSKHELEAMGKVVLAKMSPGSRLEFTIIEYRPRALLMRALGWERKKWRWNRGKVEVDAAGTPTFTRL